MYVAHKRLALGPRVFEPGDEIDRDTQKWLSENVPGRLLQLVSQNAVEHLTDEGALERRIALLEDVLADLSARIIALETRRGPGRPRKEEAE